MKRAVRSLILLSLFLSLALIALPLAVTADDTVSGKVTAVGDKTFTVEKDGGGTMDFVTDEKTQTEGDLKEGAKVSVTYRAEGDKNIAIHVKVEA